MKEKILVSACLLGVNCKYNGGNNENELVTEYIKDKEVIIICPEIMGGLSTPRDPSEIKNNKVYSINGKDVTDNFVRGAKEALKLAKKFNVKKALLKSKSPSCGSKYIYDGTFNNILIEGEGLTSKLLKANGLEIITEKDLQSQNN